MKLGRKLYIDTGFDGGQIFVKVKFKLLMEGMTVN